MTTADAPATTPAALTWGELAALLAPARNYWVSTVAPGSGPHAAPVWAVVLDDVWYAYTERTSVKARNVAADPRVVVHLESGDDVVLVRGTVEEVTDPGILQAVADAYPAKYSRPDDLQYNPLADDPTLVFLALRPGSAMVWQLSAYDDSQRRWTAPA